MAFKISAADQKRLDAHVAELKKQRSAVEDAIEAYNATVAEAHVQMTIAVDAYNEKLADAHGALEDIHREKEEELDRKSDKWKESNDTSDIDEWIEKIDEAVQMLSEDLDVDAAPVIDPEALFETDKAEELEGLPIEPEPQ